MPFDYKLFFITIRSMAYLVVDAHNTPPNAYKPKSYFNEIFQLLVVNEENQSAYLQTRLDHTHPMQTYR